MRLAGALVAASIVAAASQLAVAAVLAQGQATVAVVGGADEPAREWDIDIAGGTASTDHVTLAPVAVGFEGEFTVAIAGSAATVTLTTVLPVERELATVGCLDDVTPPTEINPAIDGSSFTFDVVPDRRYRCFVASLPAVPGDAAGAPADAIQAPNRSPLPRSDASTTSPSGFTPGWPAVVVALVAILGIAALLRPVRR